MPLTNQIWGAAFSKGDAETSVPSFSVSASFGHSDIQGFNRLTILIVAVVDLRQLAKFTKPYIIQPKPLIESHKRLTTGRLTMFDVRNSDARRLHRLAGFVVLSATLYASCMILSVELGGSLFLHMLAYSTILLAFVRLSKRAIANYYKSIGESTRHILGNAIGILIGTCIMLLLEKLLSNHSDIILAIILSGIMAFFVLGTLCPLVDKTSLGHK